MMTRVLDWLAAGMRGTRTAAAELFWPRECAACGQGLGGAAGLCAECAATLEPLGPSRPLASCARCAAPQRAGAGEDAADFMITARQDSCRDCRRLDPAVHKIRAAFAYEGALAIALMRLKWQGRDDLAAPLGTLLAPLLVDALTRCDVVTPVPLHPRRLRARGYNQAALLLQAGLAACPGAAPTRPLLTGLLRRTVLTEPARAHGPLARKARVAGAFSVPAHHQLTLRARRRRVLLVDDVVTTGATVSACAAALHAAGATYIEVVALLRASP